ncbi:hypothetical protein HBB16_19175 [Pseudonocardia sp. MCCB 268]|nr:hypothetical protein [Pseudonocardia cytotoxica]
MLDSTRASCGSPHAAVLLQLLTDERNPRGPVAAHDTREEYRKRTPEWRCCSTSTRSTRPRARTARHGARFLRPDLTGPWSTCPAAVPTPTSPASLTSRPGTGCRTALPGLRASGAGWIDRDTLRVSAPTSVRGRRRSPGYLRIACRWRRGT